MFCGFCFLSGNLDVIRQDWQPGQLHGGVLSDLLRVIGGAAALQDDAIVPHENSQIANAPSHSPEYLRFQPLFLICRSVR